MVHCGTIKYYWIKFVRREGNMLSLSSANCRVDWFGCINGWGYKTFAMRRVPKTKAYILIINSKISYDKQSIVVSVSSRWLLLRISIIHCSVRTIVEARDSIGLLFWSRDDHFWRRTSFSVDESRTIEVRVCQADLQFIKKQSNEGLHTSNQRCRYRSRGKPNSTTSLPFRSMVVMFGIIGIITTSSLL